MNAAERAAAVRTGLAADARFGARIAWPDEAGSANDLCHADGRPGFAALAERQTAGRGQHGRTWEAPAGRGVLLSAVAPAAPFADDAFLAALAAVGVADALAERHAAVRLKWPNDVLLGGRKIAGALVERRRVAVLGVGVNVLQTTEELPPAPRWPATSLHLSGVAVPDRVALAAAILSAWDRRWREAERDGPEALHRAWAALAWPDLGTPVVAALADGSPRNGTLRALRLDRGVALEIGGAVHAFPAARVAGVVPDAGTPGSGW